jgi:hypothetical protein
VSSQKLSGLPDIEWIPVAAQKEWVIVTADRNARTRGLSHDDLAAIGARMIYFAEFFDHMRSWERAKFLVRTMDSLVHRAARLARGHALVMVKSGAMRPLTIS